MGSIPHRAQSDPQRDFLYAFIDAKSRPSEVEAELRASDDAMWRAAILWLIEGQRQGAVPDDAGLANAAITVELPAVVAKSGDPFTLTIDPVIVYIFADPSAPWLIPLLGPNAALNRALGLTYSDRRIRSWNVTSEIVSPYQWMRRLDAAPPEPRRCKYPLSPKQVRKQFADIGREPLDGKTLANYAKDKLIPFFRDDASEHRRYPSDAVARILAINNLRKVCHLDLPDIANRIDRSNWYPPEDRLVND